MVKKILLALGVGLMMVGASAAPTFDFKNPVAVGRFEPGEGCVKGFLRLGYIVTKEACVEMAREAGKTVTYRLERPKRPAMVVIHLDPEEPFAVVQDEKGRLWAMLAPSVLKK